MASAAENARTIFFAAVERTPAERGAFLDAACGGDALLRQRVEALLRAHDESGAFLSEARPEFDATMVPPSASPLVGTILAGRYKLLEQIGEGGMGTVWVAEQTQPVRRRIALKLIKAGMDSKAVVARFEAERQALALMDHPNIAKVLDGGVTEQGRPFFVMEYVKGIPLTQYCDEARLTIEERLELFLPVCQAVQHAHQKGIVHRDLKPSNILVCLYDEKPAPKVIDFGLAKAMHQPLADQTLYTAHGAIMGTPLYMSPEQAQLNNLDIDTRTDIYSLGVILYELLTGTTPLEKQRFKEAAWQEMLRLIKDEEPQRPSMRLSNSGTLPSIAAQRRMEPVKLSQLMKGELDWVVMKALEKDRSRRYETASGFALDVRRYLAGEAVQAVPPSAGYRLRKFLGRNKAAAIATGLVLLALVVGLAGTSWQAFRAERESARARAAERDAVEQRTHAENQRREVQRIAAGLQVDLDVAEIKTDEKLGLLRLTKTLKNIPEDCRDLRGFVAAAVLLCGQEHAPLLRPITHDGHGVLGHLVSPDHRTLLTYGHDFTLRLWDIRNARPIAILQQDAERVVNYRYSPDGRTVFTDDQASVARFWNTNNGSCRAATEPRENRYCYDFEGRIASDGSRVPGNPNQDFGSGTRTVPPFQVSNHRLLTWRQVEKDASPGTFEIQAGPVELWDTSNGKVIARLDEPDRDAERFKFHSGGKWISAVESPSSVLVFSSEDGRLVQRLNHPPDESVRNVFVSPSGRRMATATQTLTEKAILRIWDASTWRAGSDAAALEKVDCPLFELQFVTDELLVGNSSYDTEAFYNIVYHIGQMKPRVWDANSPCYALLPAGTFARYDSGEVFDTRNLQRLIPPAGKTFHPMLARFTADGRFVNGLNGGWANQFSVIDTTSDRSIPMRARREFGHLPGVGLVAATRPDPWYRDPLGYRLEIRMIPTDALVTFPPALLELWLQVVLRGETAPDGEFVPWDESAWDRKRIELAAAPVPLADFPFPGYVAGDRLHWLRQEFEKANDAGRPQLARQLLDRAEAADDKLEAVRWRAVLARLAGPKEPTAPK